MTTREVMINDLVLHGYRPIVVGMDKGLWEDDSDNAFAVEMGRARPVVFRTNRFTCTAWSSLTDAELKVLYGYVMRET